MFSRSIQLALAAAVIVVGAYAQAPKTPAPSIRYGANPAAGKTFTHDGVKLYYEVYGIGEPLLVIHGNGSSIGELKAQIEYFRQRHMVIAMDSRDHGKSADSPDKLTYEKMTDDLAALLDHLKVPSANVLGWSDGGIEALLLAMRHPTKVKKIVSMAANIYPDGLYPEILKLINDTVKSADRTTPAGRRELKVNEMMLTEPRITPKALEAIRVPALILAADHDAIRDEHTLEIYHHIPNSQLSIFPNATHMIPYDDPALFNATVERFLRAPFVKKDRLNDLLKSMEAAKKSVQ